MRRAFVSVWCICSGICALECVRDACFVNVLLHSNSFGPPLGRRCKTRLNNVM